MNLLLDTNVLVAALVARGTCSELLEHCVRQHVVVSSQSLLNELREVLERKFSQRAIDVRAALQLFAETFTLVTPDTLDPRLVGTATTMSCLRPRWLAGAPPSSVVIRVCWSWILFHGTRVLAPSAFWKWESHFPRVIRQIRGCLTWPVFLPQDPILSIDGNPRNAKTRTVRSQ